MAGPRPAPIRTDTSNAFAHRTIRVRIPVIIQEVQTLNPDYPAPIQAALDRLRQSMQNDEPVPLIDLPAPDYEEWAAIYAPHQGETWQATQWFFAEIYVYRLLVQAVRWWETLRDPFAPKKAAEMSGEALWKTLDSALAVRDDASLTVEERLNSMIHHTLWGNRIDLSYELARSHGGEWISEDLIVDDGEQAAEHLLRVNGTVHFVNDNAGTELAMDLAMADCLLDGIADRVIFHLKMHPTFVSDATVPDVLDMLSRLEAGNAAACGLAERLRAAITAGRLRLTPDLFWNTSHFMRETPPRLAALFRDAALVIVKGDVNYRRLVDDALWPPTTPFAEALDYFPAPALALRTLKSDPIVGLPEGLYERLDSVDKDWRINGRRGIIQFSPGSAPGRE